MHNIHKHDKQNVQNFKLALLHLKNKGPAKHFSTAVSLGKSAMH
jgi:hypothetical protein